MASHEKQGRFNVLLNPWQSTFGDGGVSSLGELSVETDGFAAFWATEFHFQQSQLSGSLLGDHFHVEVLWQRYGSRFSASSAGVANATDFVLTNRGKTTQQNGTSKPTLLSAGLLEHDFGADEGESPWKESPWNIGHVVTDAAFARFGHGLGYFEGKDRTG